MKKSPRAPRRALGFLVLAAGAFAALAATASSGSARAVSIAKPASLPAVKVGPVASFKPGGGNLCAPTLGFNCYGPADIRAGYDYPSGDGAPDGAGQTIVIVDAYGTQYEAATGDPLNYDLAVFDAFFGLPAPPGGGVTVVAGPDVTHCAGPPDCSGDPAGWAGEIALDVEWAHAMAPGANIVLASAASDSNEDMNAAEQAILPQYPGAIVSQSFGSDEADASHHPDPTALALHSIFVDAVANGDTLVASAGDWGATNGDPYIMASYPASDPLVLSVGGTEGLSYPNGLVRNGHYAGEQVWNEPQFAVPGLGSVATGGAPSVVWPAPSWQSGLTRYSSGSNPMRTVPDVSYNAAIEGGVLTVEGVPDEGPNLWIVGGTSSGSPQWAGILALANQVRATHGRPGIGVAAEPLYTIAGNARSYQADFHDITLGNDAQGSGNKPLHAGDLGFPATQGYDLASGLGTPDVSNLLAGLATAPAGTPSTGSSGPVVGPVSHGHTHATPGR